MRLVIAAGIAVGLASGCNSHGRPLAQQCAVAARQGIDAMVERARARIAAAQLPPDVRATLEERTKQLDALAPRLRAVIANHCVDDRWPADAIDCHAKVTSMDELRACRGRLAPEQQAKLERAELDLFAGAAGPPGFAAVAAPATSPEVARLEAEQRALNTKLAEAVNRLGGASGDADREAARSAVRALQVEMEAVSARLAAARAAAPMTTQAGAPSADPAD